MEDKQFYVNYLASKALVNIRLDSPGAPAMNGSIVIFRDEATMRKAAELMGRKGPGDVDITSKGYKFSYPKSGGGTVELFGVHYDNVKRDETHQHLTPTPAEVLEESVPMVSVVTSEPGGADVKKALEQFLRERQKNAGRE